MAKQVFDLYYDEIALYDFNNPGFSSATGHFTQIIWVDSKILGCGITCNGGMCYSACEYDPPGNVQGQFETNVLPVAKVSPSDPCAEQFNNEMLKLHNEKRLLHQAPELVNGVEQQQFAQDWALQMSNMNSLVHSGGPYGENIAVSQKKDDCTSKIKI